MNNSLIIQLAKQKGLSLYVIGERISISDVYLHNGLHKTSKGMRDMNHQDT
jgi:hypothetical protein